ncbi:MAG: AAA family ATPase, partial [Candidatus Nanohaloarchaea archaeon]
ENFAIGSRDDFLITGPSGTGKTMAVKILLPDFQEEVDADIEWIYVTEPKNELQVLRRISERMELGYKGLDLSKYYELLAEEITDRDIKLVLVLDEIEKLFLESRGKNHGNSLIKQLWDHRSDPVNAEESNG